MKLGYTDISKKREFWKEQSEKISGKFGIRYAQSKSHETLLINFKHSGFDIKFSESDTQPLKVTFSSNAQSGCKISISEEDVIDKLVKLFSGNKELHVGNTEFDKQYLIQSDDSVFLRKFITNDIQTLMLETNAFAMNCITNKRTNRLEFFCTVNRQICDIEGLQKVYELTCSIVDRLKELGVI